MDLKAENVLPAATALALDAIGIALNQLGRMVESPDVEVLRAKAFGY